MAGTNFETFSHIASLSGSAIALASTTYFWLVKVNRERPAMVVEPVGSVTGSVLIPSGSLGKLSGDSPSQRSGTGGLLAEPGSGQQQRFA